LRKEEKKYKSIAREIKFKKPRKKERCVKKGKKKNYMVMLKYQFYFILTSAYT